MLLADRARMVGGAGDRFTPADLTNKAFWYDFADPDTLFTDSGSTTNVSSDGDRFTGVEDKFGNYNLNSGSAVYKTNIRNGNSVMYVDGGGDDYMHRKLASTIQSQPLTYFIVAQSEIQNPGDIIGLRVRVGSEGLKLSTFAGAHLDGDTPAVWNIGSWHLVTVTFDGAATVARLDGAEEVSGDAGTNGIYTSLVVGAITNTGAGPWQGYIAEVVCAGELTGTELADMESYLADKWDMPI